MVNQPFDLEDVLGLNFHFTRPTPIFLIYKDVYNPIGQEPTPQKLDLVFIP